MHNFKIGDRVEWSGRVGRVSKAETVLVYIRLDTGKVIACACSDPLLSHVPCDVAPWNRYEMLGIR